MAAERTETKATIGVLGGAGVLACAHAHQQLVRRCWELGARDDQDWPPLLLDNRPMAHLHAQGYDHEDRSALRMELSARVSALTAQGAAVILPVCNTITSLLPMTEAEIISLPGTALQSAHDAGAERVGVLSSRRAVAEQIFADHRLEVITYPELQGQVDQLIEALIGGYDLEGSRRQLTKIIDELPEQYVIIGCTELSMVCDIETDKQLIDALTEGINAAIRWEAA